MGFSPIYHRDRVKRSLLRLFKGLDVHSYAFYEMIGIHDLMLRLWLPTSLTLREFEAELKQALAQEGVVMTDYFAVDDTIAHWVWTDEAGRLRPVNNGILAQGLPDDVVEKINNGKLSPEDRENYERVNAIAPSGHGAGIKFFIIITAGMLPTSMLYTQQTLSDEIAELVQQASSVKEKSLYMGSGGLGQFLVMGKVRTAQFPKIFTELIDPINALGLSHDFRSRTYTHICTRGLVEFVDVLPPWQDVVRDSKIRPIEDYLREEESRVLEVKGSAFVNVVSWINTKKPTFDENILAEGILRSVVGMLNADGGTIVVGALETREPFVKAALEGNPLADAPQFEDRYIIFGVEQDYRVAGSTKDWDAFLQRLNRKIRDRVEPQPTPWVTIEPQEFLGRPMAVISVREPDSGWFYLCENKDDPGDFHVRQENETSVLAGALADEYKRAKKRI